MISDDSPERNKQAVIYSYGYFTVLGVRFTSTYQQIERYRLTFQLTQKYFKRNYNALMNHYSDGNAENNQVISKIQEAYQIIKDDQLRTAYLNNLIVRSYLQQAIDLQLDFGQKKEAKKLFPFFIFEVFKEGNSDSHILTFNFVFQTIAEQKKEVNKKSVMFSNISSALQGKKEDEFIINYIENGKIMSQNYRAKFSIQRSQIVTLANLAKEIFEETKPTLEFHNPNTKQDYSLYKIQHFSIGENWSSKASSFNFEKNSIKNNFFWNDAVVPPPHLQKVQACKANQKKFTYFTVGKTHMLLSRKENVQDIFQVIPLRKEYLSFNREDNCITIQVLDKTRKYKFIDKQAANNLIYAINTIFNQKAQLPNLILTNFFPENNNIFNQFQQKREDLSHLNKKISQIEGQLSELKLKRQQLLNELHREECNLQDIDEDTLDFQKNLKTIYQIPMKPNGT